MKEFHYAYLPNWCVTVETTVMIGATKGIVVYNLRSVFYIS